VILRRLADVIRRQDWFTVAVETLIVVLGVFVGLQVNDMSSGYGSWRHRRCARASRPRSARLRPDPA